MDGTQSYWVIYMFFSETPFHGFGLIVVLILTNIGPRDCHHLFIPTFIFLLLIDNQAIYIFANYKSNMIKYIAFNYKELVHAAVPHNLAVTHLIGALLYFTE